MNNKYNKVILLFLCLICTIAYSQENSVLFNEAESLDRFPEGIYKEEMSLFVKSCNNDTTINLNTVLRESYCYGINKNTADFAVGRDKALSIEIEGDNNNSRIVCISYSFLKRYYNIPDSAICDIINPTFSIYIIMKREAIKEYFESHGFHRGIWGIPKSIQIIDNWKVYGSKDFYRIYIHMVNYKYRYEVTWIIDGDKYVGRVIDKF